MKLINALSSDHSSIWSLIGGFVAFLIIIRVTRIIYSVFFGPLSKYPGPKLAKATRLLYTWHKVRGHTEEWIVSLHSRYGDIVQTAPGQISFASGHAWKDIYGHNTGGKTRQFNKDPTFYGSRQYPGQDIIFSSDADHTRMRRNLAHAFSDRALREQEPLLRKYVNQMISQLGKQNREPVDLVRWYNYTTFDIMGDLTFGEPLGCLTSGDYTPWVAMIFQSIKAGTLLVESKHYDLLGRILRRMIPKSMLRKREAHWALSSAQVDKRIAKEDPRPDIWGIVLGAKEEQRLSITEMHANSQILMLAGTETTATLLSGLTHLLLSNPDKLALVKGEVRGTFQTVDQIDVDAILRLKYLNACFEEALRCYPPVPLGLPRIVPEGGEMVCGQFMPAGTQVAVHQLSAYRNPNNFRRADEFIPERWLGDPEFTHDERAALQPFSIGPRNCIGKNLAYLEMRLIFAMLIWTYDIELCEESRNWRDQKQYNFWEKHPLMVTLEPVIREKTLG